MDDDVGTVVDRPAEPGRGERVVDHEGDSRLVGDRGDALDVEDVDHGVADRLRKDRLGLRTDRAAEIFRVVRVDELGLDA